MIAEILFGSALLAAALCIGCKGGDWADRRSERREREDLCRRCDGALSRTRGEEGGES